MSKRVKNTSKIARWDGSDSKSSYHVGVRHGGFLRAFGKSKFQRLQKEVEAQKRIILSDELISLPDNGYGSGSGSGSGAGDGAGSDT